MERTNPALGMRDERRTVARHIIVKIQNTKGRQKNLQAFRERERKSNRQKASSWEGRAALAAKRQWSNAFEIPIGVF